MDTRSRWPARRSTAGGAALALLCAALACGVGGCGTADLADVDPAAIASAPTYSEHVGPMMHYYCSSCHAPRTQLGPNLGGYDYSSYSGVVAGFTGIEQTVFEQGNMPPGGAPKLTLVEQETLRAWQQLGFPQ